MLLPLGVAAFAAASATTAVADAPNGVLKAQKSGLSQGRIVGGTQIPVTATPWQVKVNIRRAAGGDGSLCGGSIINATTVVTAAHCVTDSATVPNAVSPPALISVDAGSSRYSPTTGAAEPQPGDAPQRVGVSVNRVHPGYPRNLDSNGSGTLADFVDDVATLTLSSPLDLSGPAKQPIALTAQNVVSPIGAGGTVAGFGLQSQDPAIRDGNLFAIDETVQDASVGPVGPLNALFVVGAAPAGSFCSGDSGGALQLGGAMLGIVSNNVSCDAAQSNVYTNVSAAEIQMFINGNDSPPQAPRGGENVELTVPRGATTPPRRGDTLTCSAGTWTNSPFFTYAFTDTKTNKVLQRGGSTKFRVTGRSDARATISCRAEAANAGGVGLTPPTGTTEPVVAAPRDRLSLGLKASAVRSARGGTKRRARGSAPVRVRRGQRVVFTLGVRNRRNRAQTNVRRCIRLSSRFTLVKRGGGKVSGGRICFTARSLKPRSLVRRRVVVRIDRDSRTGRLVTRAGARSRQGARDSARRTLFVRGSGLPVRPRPPGVTG
ncbi:MAG: S1 family serine peptidase [Thermoleophilaceae bacterium]